MAGRGRKALATTTGHLLHSTSHDGSGMGDTRAVMGSGLVKQVGICLRLRFKRRADGGGSVGKVR